MIQKKKAFSMLELVFVIVVIGILSKFGVEFLAQAYRNFIYSNINNKLQAKSEAAVEFIAKRLQYRIKGSEVSRIGLIGAPTSINNANVTGQNWTVLEWVSEDVDGYRGIRAPYWSGVLDLDDPNTANNNLISLGTNLTDVSTNIHNLGGVGIADTAIHFVGGVQDIRGFGYENPGVGVAALNSFDRSIHLIGGNANAITGTFGGVETFEYYKLAWTAYGIHHDNSDRLWLYYNYQPWLGDDINDNGIQRQLIMENVSSFRFIARESLIKIQVCVKSLLTNEEYSICKEKTVF